MSEITNQLINVIKSALKEKYNLDNVDNLIMIEIPKEKKFGDYSSNIALRLSKQLHDNPMNIASNIKETLLKEDLIKDIDIVKPGFINFFLSNDSLSSVIKKVITSDKDYGRSDLNNGKSIMVEYVSANPTGDLHLGHARGAAYGDSLTRILSFSGYNILREFYVNDAGNQIEVLSHSLFERYKESLGLPFDIEKIGYQGKDVKVLAEKIKNDDGDKWIHVDEPIALDYFKNLGTELELEKLKKDLSLFRVEFDHYQSERELYKENKVINCLEELKHSPYTYEKDGALWLKTTDFNDDKDRVLVKSDGTLTYLTPDIAYHKDKFDRGYDYLIDILGADHHGYIARLKASIKILGYNPDHLDVLLIQMVRLMEEGKEVKMSKRTGNAITIRELCEDVGVDAARYFFISKPIESHFDFDLSLARKHSSENPVFYIQYAYARMSSILEKKSDYQVLDSYNLLTDPKEIDLMKQMDGFQKVIEEISISKEVNKLCNYIYKFCQTFHSYYNESIIIDDKNEELSLQRIALIKAASIVLRNSLYLIGIDAKEKM